MILAAQNGAKEPLGQMWEACRPYLGAIANQHLDSGIRVKLGASDLVQQTFLEAQVGFHRFRGTTEKELLAWLRRILLNNLKNENRKYRETMIHNIGREVPFPPAQEGDGLISPEDSPPAQLIARERAEALDRALEYLPEDYREVILLRNRVQLPWSEVGVLMDRTPDAACKLWTRALVTLHELLESSHETP